MVFLIATGTFIISLLGQDYISALPHALKTDIFCASIGNGCEEYNDPVIAKKQLIVFSRISKSWYFFVTSIAPRGQFTALSRDPNHHYNQLKQLLSDTDNPVFLMAKVWMEGGHNKYHVSALDLILKSDPSLCKEFSYYYPTITAGLWVLRVKTITVDVNGLRYGYK